MEVNQIHFKRLIIVEVEFEQMIVMINDMKLATGPISPLESS
jgi:hypothetical protein